MRLEARAETILERIGLWLGLAPEPLLHTQIAYLTARAILTATQIGVFDAVADGPRTLGEIAQRCGAQADALRSVVGMAVSVGLLRHREGRFTLARQARRWLVSSSEYSLADQMAFLDVIWNWMAKLNEFVRTGKPLDYHETFSSNDWKIYQRAMRAVAKISAEEVGRRTPVPRGATGMLDIGGSHGLFSAVLCRRHGKLRSTILDLPRAVEEGAALLAAEGLGERVRYQEGDALKVDLGHDRYDVILIASLVHHFSDKENRDLARRCGEALRRGGYLVIQDFLRPAKPRRGDQVGQALDLLFALTSRSGTWSIEEMQSWEREAGLAPHKVVKLRTLPSFAQVVGRKV